MKHNEKLVSELLSLGVKVKAPSKRVLADQDDLLVRRWGTDVMVRLGESRTVETVLPLREAELCSSYRMRHALALEIAAELGFPGSHPERRNPWTLVHGDGTTSM